MKDSSKSSQPQEEGIVVRLPRLPSINVSVEAVERILPILAKNVLALVLGLALLVLAATLVVGGRGGSLDLGVGSFEFHMKVPHAELNRLQMRPLGKDLQLSYVSLENKRVSMKDPVNGKTICEGQTECGCWTAKLANLNEKPLLRSIRVGNDPLVAIAIPGSRRSDVLTGRAQSSKLLLAVAGYFDVTIIARDIDLAKAVQWNFTGLSAPVAIRQALGNECTIAAGRGNLLNVDCIHRGSISQSRFSDGPKANVVGRGTVGPIQARIIGSGESIDQKLRNTSEFIKLLPKHGVYEIRHGQKRFGQGGTE